MNQLISFCYDEDGQTMVEYALIAGIMAVIAIALLVLVGKKVNSKFHSLNNQL